MADFQEVVLRVKDTIGCSEEDAREAVAATLEALHHLGPKVD